eukprot:sb/3477319/
MSNHHSLSATTYIRIHKAAQLGDLKTIEAACEDDADLNQTDRFSKTPLMVASANGRPQIVAVLLKHGYVRREDVSQCSSQMSHRARRLVRGSDKRPSNSQVSHDFGAHL